MKYKSATLTDRHSRKSTIMAKILWNDMKGKCSFLHDETTEEKIYNSVTSYILN